MQQERRNRFGLPTITREGIRSATVVAMASGTLWAVQGAVDGETILAATGGSVAVGAGIFRIVFEGRQRRQ